MSRRVQMPDGRIAEFPDDMDDAAITRAIVQATPQADVGDRPPLTATSAERFASGAIGEPLAHAGAAISATTSALSPGGDTETMPGMGILKLLGDTVGGVYSAAKDQYGKALDQYDSAGGLSNRGPTGRGLSTVGRVIAGAVPVVGPMAASAVDRGTSGDVAGGIGQVAGLEGVAGGELLRRLAAKPAAIEARNAAAAGERAATTARTTAVYDVDQAAKEAAWIKEADRIRAMRQANVPTDIQSANTALGVKPADVGKSISSARNPARTALDLGIVNPDNPGSAAAIAHKVDATFDQLTKAKEQMLDTDVVVASNAEMRKIAKSMNAAIKKAKIEDPEAAAHLVKIRRIADEFVSPQRVRKIDPGTGNEVISLSEPMFPGDLKPRDVVTVMTRIRNEVANMPQSVIKTKLGSVAGTLSKQYNALLQKALGPEYKTINSRMRDMVGVKAAVNRKGVAEIAGGVPREQAIPDIPPLPERMDMPAGPGGSGGTVADPGFSTREALRLYASTHAPGSGVALGGARLLQMLERLRQ